jgi:hypothetical protein
LNKSSDNHKTPFKTYQEVKQWIFINLVWAGNFKVFIADFYHDFNSCITTTPGCKSELSRAVIRVVVNIWEHYHDVVAPLNLETTQPKYVSMIFMLMLG